MQLLNIFQFAAAARGLKRLSAAILLTLSALLLLAACDDDNSRLAPVPTLPTLPSVIPYGSSLADRRPSSLTPSPSPAIVRTTTPTAPPPVTRQASAVAGVAACTVLTRADAEAALKTAGGTGTLAAAPSQETLTTGSRCTFRSSTESVSLEIVRPATKAIYEADLRRYARGIGSSVPGAPDESQLFSSPILMGVGRTYIAWYAFVRAIPSSGPRNDCLFVARNGALFVAVDGAYVIITVRPAASPCGLQPQLAAGEGIARQAIIRGDFRP